MYIYIYVAGSFTYNVATFLFSSLCARLIVCMVLRAVAFVPVCLPSSLTTASASLRLCLCVSSPSPWSLVAPFFLSSLFFFHESFPLPLRLFCPCSPLPPPPCFLSFCLFLLFLYTTKTHYYRHHPPLRISLPMGRIGVLGVIMWWYSWSTITRTSVTTTTTAGTIITTTATTTTTINTITARSTRSGTNSSTTTTIMTTTLAPLIPLCYTLLVLLHIATIIRSTTTT